jgi:hypothetical protein
MTLFGVQLTRSLLVSDRGAKGTIDYRRLDKGSYLGFLVAMAVCLLIAKALILFFKLINLQEKIPYFDVFVSHESNLLFNAFHVFLDYILVKNCYISQCLGFHSSYPLNRHINSVNQISERQR